MKVDVKELIGKILNTPVVVETGTSGIWNYRKWSNGTAECWGAWYGTLSHYSTYAGFYGYYQTVGLPSGLFTVAPIVNYSAYVGGGFALTGTCTANTTTTISVYALASGSGSQTVGFHMYCIGKWK